MLSVDNVVVNYGQSEALHGVSFAVAQGETVAIMGRNGMGKTTLFKAMIGMLPVRSGEVRVDGRDVAREESYRRVRAGLGYVPQGRMIFSHLSVEENILTGMQQGSARRIPEDIFAMFPVCVRDAQAQGRQPVGRPAAATGDRARPVAEPKVLLLDEPTEGIQPSIIKDIARALDEIRRTRGITIVFSEQVLSLRSTWPTGCWSSRAAASSTRPPATAPTSAISARCSRSERPSTPISHFPPPVSQAGGIAMTDTLIQSTSPSRPTKTLTCTTAGTRTSRWPAGSLGDDFILETYDWTGGFIQNNDSADDVRDIDLSIVHFLSGPVGVEGAEPGDLLVVDLLDIGAKADSQWGFNGFFSVQNGGGFLTDHFRRRRSRSGTSTACSPRRAIFPA